MAGVALVALSGLASTYLQVLRSPVAYASTTCAVTVNQDDSSATTAGTLSGCLYLAGQAGGDFTIDLQSDVILGMHGLKETGLPGNTSLTILGNGRTVDGDDTGTGLALKFTANGNNRIEISDLTITDTLLDDTIENSTTSNYGGALYIGDNATPHGDTYAKLSGVVISNSRLAPSTGDQAGGALWLYQVDAAISDSRFTANRATYRGGAIMANGGDVVISDSYFANNSLLPNLTSADPTNAGGAVVSGIIGSFLTPTNLTITGTTFKDDSAVGNGGAVAAFSGTVTLADDTFTGGYAQDGMGGALYLAPAASLNVADSRFTDNVADDTASTLGDGGAIAANNPGPISISGSTFARNVGDRHGGSIFVKDLDDTLSITGSTFTDDSALAVGSGQGGSVNVDDSANLGSLLIADSTFSRGQAGHVGGALRTAVATRIIDSTFVGNSADDTGGAVASTNDVEIVNSTLVGNSTVDSGSAGGAVYVSGASKTLDLDFVTMSGNATGNSTNAGSAIWASDASVSLVQSVIDDTQGVPCALTGTASVSDAFTFAVDPSDSCGLTGTGSDNSLTSSVLQLGSLANNGGPTLTMLPTRTSPLVTQGPATNALPFTTDQRGVTRLAPFTVGAVQVNPLPPPPPVPSGPPTSVTAVQRDASALVSWSPPVSSGSFPVTTYRVTGQPGGQGCLVAAPALTCTVTGLTNGETYTFSVTALTGAGWSPPAQSNPVTPGGATPTPEPAPLPEPLAPGESLLLVDGVPDSDVVVEANASDNGLVITGQAWTMDLDGLGPDGKPLNLGPDDALRLAESNRVVTRGSGFLPNSDVLLSLDPPVLVNGADGNLPQAGAIVVGTVRTDARGRFSGTATLPADIAPGEHVLQAVGYSPSAQVRAMSLGVIVDPWITLDQGTRKAQGRLDRITTGGDTGGVDVGTRLTPWIQYSGQNQFQKGKATIRVQSDGSFRWTRKIRANRGLRAYVSWTDVESNRVFWKKVR